MSCKVHVLAPSPYGINLYYIENKLKDETKIKGKVCINDWMMLLQRMQFFIDM